MKLLQYLIFIFLISSCDSDWVPGIKASSDKAEIDSFLLLPSPKVKGSVFLFGPKVDSLNCKLSEAACNCCRERLIFTNDSEFIAISYCEENESFCKGKYIFYGPQVILNFSNKRFDYILQKDHLYKSADRRTISERVNQMAPWIFVNFNCSEKIGLKNESETLFGFEDTVSTDFMVNDIAGKGILEKLNN
jgi:hypothetical protein